MSRLFHAGIFRLKKNKVYIGALIAVSLFIIFTYIMYYYRMMKLDIRYPFDPLIFNFLIIIGIVTAVFIPLFIGTEYSDGTIRNKLIVGMPRSSVYLSNFLTCIMGEIVIVVVAYIVGIILGIPLVGYMEMSLDKVLLASNGIFLSLVYVSVFYMITMVSSNKTTSVVICILMAFGIFMVSVSLFSKLSEPEFIEQMVNQNGEAIMETVKNPNYLSENKREIYQKILDFLPSGQAMNVVNQRIDNHGIMIVYSVITIIITNTIGVFFFYKKDIK